MSTTFQAIGERLRRLRRAAGQTQLEFAETLGTSLRSYKGYETGKRELPTSIVFKVCEITSVSPSWVLMGERDALDQTTLNILRESLTTGERLLEFSQPRNAKQKAEYLMLLIKLSLKQHNSISEEDAKAILDVGRTE